MIYEKAALKHALFQGSFYVQEYCHGGMLVKTLGSKGLLPPTDATDCSIALQLSQSCKHSGLS